MLLMLFRPLAVAEWGLDGELGCEPTMYGTRKSILMDDAPGMRLHVNTGHRIFSEGIVYLALREVLELD
jgi:hypothetical protein